MADTFAGKVALITGGTTGIGRATALAMARQGARVVVAGRRAEEGADTVQLIKDSGGDAMFVKADVTQAQDVQNLVAHTVKTFGRLDVAFNNAGTEEVITPFHEETEANFQHIMDVNVKGVWLCMKAQILEMLKQGSGAIVNNSSIGGLIGFPGVAVYTASKHAVIGLTKTAALEYAKLGIRINAIAPAAIQTELLDRLVSGAQFDLKHQLPALHPMGRIGRPEEVVGAVLWLCSDTASFVTGQTVAVDGGYTAQ